jgi:hypothetical protein
MSKAYGNLILMTLICVIIFWIFMGLRPAPAQGLGPYMGRDGRVHAQVIAGPDGSIWPVIPTYCQHSWGPCPVPLGPPIRPFAAFGPPPLAYAPAEPPPPPQPMGWIWGRLAPCAAPDCTILTVQVAVDGANVRAAPGGPVIGALANGVPIVPLQKVDGWILIAPACPLVPTYTYSVTSGGVALSVCGL